MTERNQQIADFPQEIQNIINNNVIYVQQCHSKVTFFTVAW